MMTSHAVFSTLNLTNSALTSSESAFQSQAGSQGCRDRQIQSPRSRSGWYQTRIYKAHTMLSDLLNGKTLNRSINLDEAAANSNTYNATIFNGEGSEAF